MTTAVLIRTQNEDWNSVAGADELVPEAGLKATLVICSGSCQLDPKISLTAAVYNILMPSAVIKMRLLILGGGQQVPGKRSSPPPGTRTCSCGSRLGPVRRERCFKGSCREWFGQCSNAATTDLPNPRPNHPTVKSRFSRYWILMARVWG